LDYYPFGSIRIDKQYQNFDETKKYTGHEFDDESGLYYAQARYYDAEIGRFISSDPLTWKPNEFMNRFGRLPQGMNQYSYTINNPIILIDPNGEEAYEIGFSLSFSWLHFGGIWGKGLAWDNSGGRAKYSSIGGSLGSSKDVIPKVNIGIDFSYKPLANTVNDLDIDKSTDVEVCYYGCVSIPSPTRAIDGSLDELSIGYGLGAPSVGIEDTQKVYQKTKNPDDIYHIVETGEKIRISQPESPNMPVVVTIEGEPKFKSPSKKTPSPTNNYWKKRQQSVDQQGLPSNIQGPARADGSF